MAKAKKVASKSPKGKAQHKTSSTKAGSAEKPRPKAVEQVKHAVEEVRVPAEGRETVIEEKEQAKQKEREEKEETLEKKKAVDEDWKEQVHREKEAKKEEKPPPIPPPNFILFVSGFATQTLIALGQIENPITKTKEKNLDQAKYTIDTLAMIKEKTKGNLTTEEEKFLDSVLYDLQMSYVSSVE